MQATERGFTFIELLIVIALVGTILSFSMVMGMDSITHANVKGERDLLVSLVLMGARSHAIANINGTAHGVHIDTDTHTYVLFEGDSYDADASTNRTINFTNDAIDVLHTGGASDIVFEQLSGDVIRGVGTITITQGSTALTVELNEAGRINW
jgi:prepilin-type N-terminal cleavage/methylation domain-containing protein